MDQVSFRIDKGDKIGLVGRNGAGKTTLTRVLAGEGLPAAGKVTRTGEIGYLPQDPRTPDMEQLARDRILSVRGLDIAVGKLRLAHEEMASEDAAVQRKAMNRYDRLESEFLAAGGYAAEAEAAAICSNLALPDRLLNQPLKTLSGGQRRRVELARILYSDAETMLLDEPTNHLDADSISWLREFLKNHQGGPDRHQPRHRTARSDRQQGLPPRSQPRPDRLLQHGLEALPHPARNGRARPQA